ncbi:MAG: sporulation protein YabP [Bacilli bacterium]|nr:sporulation protein YabP [Bacilli bacterium]
MEKLDDAITNYNHGITLVERKSLIVTGVKKIENFDDEEFLMETIMGFLIVKGEGLELIKLDTMQGNVSIKGIIKGLNYVEDVKQKDKEQGIFNRLFK